MKSFPAILLCLALCAGSSHAGLFPDHAFSDDARGLAGAQFLKVPPSARFASLAGAGLSLYGADAFFLNPAGAYGRNGALSVSYGALLAGSSRTGLVFSRPSGRGTLSAALIYNNYTPGLDVLDGAGGGNGAEVTAYDAAAGAGWARRFGWLDLGVNLKYIKSRLAEASGATVALDAGIVLRQPSPSRTELALAARNFGPPMKLGSEKAPLPFELAGGLKWKYAPDFNILMEGRLPCDHAPYLVFAGELFLPYSADSGLFLRSGINFKNYDDHGAMGAFAGGFGVKLGGLSLDYAFSPYGELGAAHRLTAGLAWGGPTSQKNPPSVRLPAGALVVVAPFSAEGGVTETDAAVMRNLVEAELAKGGRFSTVDRTRLEFILKERKLAYAGLSDKAAAAELGRATGAGLALFGSVSRGGKGYLISVGLSDVKSGAVLRVGTRTVAEDYLFRSAARELASELSR